MVGFPSCSMVPACWALELANNRAAAAKRNPCEKDIGSDLCGYFEFNC